MKLFVNTVFKNVTLERFLEVYFSEDFNNRVAAVSGLKSRRLVEEKRHDDGSRDRRVRIALIISPNHPGERGVSAPW